MLHISKTLNIPSVYLWTTYLLRIHVEDLGSCCASCSHKPAGIHLARMLRMNAYNYYAYYRLCQLIKSSPHCHCTPTFTHYLHLLPLPHHYQHLYSITLSMVIDITVYFRGEKYCTRWRYDGQIDTEKTSSGWNPALNLNLHIYMYILFCHTITQNKMKVRCYNVLDKKFERILVSCIFY